VPHLLAIETLIPVFSMTRAWLYSNLAILTTVQLEKMDISEMLLRLVEQTRLVSLPVYIPK